MSESYKPKQLLEYDHFSHLNPEELDRLKKQLRVLIDTLPEHTKKRLENGEELSDADLIDIVGTLTESQVAKLNIPNDAYHSAKWVSVIMYPLLERASTEQLEIISQSTQRILNECQELFDQLRLHAPLQVKAEVIEKLIEDYGNKRGERVAFDDLTPQVIFKAYEFRSYLLLFCVVMAIISGVIIATNIGHFLGETLNGHIDMQEYLKLVIAVQLILFTYMLVKQFRITNLKLYRGIVRESIESSLLEEIAASNSFLHSDSASGDYLESTKQKLQDTSKKTDQYFDEGSDPDFHQGYNIES